MLCVEVTKVILDMMSSEPSLNKDRHTTVTVGIETSIFKRDQHEDEYDT